MINCLTKKGLCERIIFDNPHQYLSARRRDNEVCMRWPVVITTEIFALFRGREDRTRSRRGNGSMGSWMGRWLGLAKYHQVALEFLMEKPPVIFATKPSMDATRNTT